MRSLRSIHVLAPLLAAAGGCFYGDPINERPSADIARQTDNPVRGGTIAVAAEAYDPDGDYTYRAWTAWAYSGDQRAAEPQTGTEIVFNADVPAFLDPDNLMGPVDRMVIELVVTDEHNARAVPTQTLEIDIGNAPPEIELQAQGHTYRGSYPVVMPMKVVGIKSDPDDTAAAVVVFEDDLFAEEGTTREGSSLMLVEETDTQVVWDVVVDEAGVWEVVVTVRDSVGAEFQDVESIPFALDQWPCIGAAEPAFPPEGADVILDQRRRFAVLSVEDDLDLWPPPPPSMYLDAATFRWWLGSPATGGALVPLDGVDGAEVWLDPALYTPGDQLELRVEAVDSEDRDLCDSALGTCEALPGCAQRRTWTVEVR
jgi:hypothetical protein